MGIGTGLGYAVQKWQEKEDARLKAEEERVLSESWDLPSKSNSYDMAGTSSGTTGMEANILNAIADNEGTGKSGYGTQYNYKDYGATKPITEMTLNEVLDHQDIMKSMQKGDKLVSTAMGRYQILQETLKDEMKRGGYTGTELFDKNTQDKLILQRLRKKRGYDAWEQGKISDKDFKRNLSREFASVIDPYTGVGHHGQGAKDLKW